MTKTVQDQTKFQGNPMNRNARTSARIRIRSMIAMAALFALIVGIISFGSVPDAKADLIVEQPIPCPDGTELNLFDSGAPSEAYHCVYPTTDGNCPNGEGFVDTGGQLPHDLCDLGIFDCGPDASFVGWGTCRPNGHEPIASETACADAAAASGQGFRWYPTESQCARPFVRPDAQLRCPFGFRVVTDEGGIPICAGLVADHPEPEPTATPDATPIPTTLVSGRSSVPSATPICIESVGVQGNPEAADLGVGSTFTANGTLYVITTGGSCSFNCSDGSDINCDGKLGDYCPSEHDRNTVAGTQACLASLTAQAAQSAVVADEVQSANAPASTAASAEAVAEAPVPSFTG